MGADAEWAGAGGHVCISPEAGMLLLFPAWLEHYVLVSLANNSIARALTTSAQTGAHMRRTPDLGVIQHRGAYEFNSSECSNP